MARLDDFFGKNAVSKNKRKRTVGSGTTPDAKRQKDDPTKSAYFNSKPVTIDLDSDTDAIVIDDDPVVVSKKKITKGTASRGAVKSVRKAAVSPVKRSRAKAEAKKGTSTGSSSDGSAEQILKTIPDADPSYLKVDPDSANLNFFQLKAKQQQDAPVEGVHRDIPKARKNCLNGLTIVFTGVLPSIDRDECERLASQYGAKVTKSISGRTSLVVIGRDAGPKKVKTIKEKHIKCVDEEGFIQLLATMPEDGGSGEAAQQALAKKQRELDKAIEDAEEEERKEGAAVAGASSSKKPSIPPSSQLWTVRYAPTELNQICGNKGNVESLYNWLDSWFSTAHDGKSTRGAGIGNYRAVLISGPPGTGKTTAANLVAHKLGYDVIEKNASDFRSKKILNQELKVCLDNTSVAGYFKEGEAEPNDKRFVLIMDEVDGMSSGDNGGVAQLAQFCRITKSPMILICNDKSLPKMRAFDRVCFDMTWRRPTAREMRSRLMTIAHREGLKLDPNVIDELVTATHNDIRQIINIMSTVSLTQKTLDFDNSDQIQQSWKKEVALKPFDVVGRLLGSGSYGDNPMYNLNEKLNLYFNDIDLVPLMIHENYRTTQPNAAFKYPSNQQNLAQLQQLSLAADSISESDLVNQNIRSGEQQWSLLPFYGVMSTIIPGSYVCGRITGRIMFTSWLGQNSKGMKYQRVVQQLQYHSSTKTHTNNQELRLTYVPYLKDVLTKPLIEQGSSGIDEVLSVLDDYYLTKEDWDNIMEMGVGNRGRMDGKLKKIPTSVKTQFTRKYNSYSHPTIIYKTGTVRPGRPQAIRYDDVIDDDARKEKEEEEEEENEQVKKEEDIGKDSLIKAVKRKGAKKSKR
ncbi:DEKNAAC104093 [Brettanomyces naardenensis]|uniref:Replication factor C subunit 1 n=1 Tax=Brettanomyces naardenensis TaxID=13370 RepID=A0A448YQ93_BRENA|nr:DEKNAAC104093 [Brettanomyces naardenensis]